jgi:PKD domain-containing protein
MRRTPRRLVHAAVAASTVVVFLSPGLGAPGPVEPTDEEQLVIWQLNRARRDPPTYGQSIGLDLTGVDPQPALAVSRLLTNSARFHAQEMYDHGYFAHTSAVTGKGPNQMAADAGYDVFGMGLSYPWGAANNIESLEMGSPTFSLALADLIIDPDPSQNLGHRIHLLGMNDFVRRHREIGAGKAASPTGAPPGPYHAIHTAYTGGGGTFLTGVVYYDADGDGAFGFMEGLGGVDVAAVPVGGGNGLATRSFVAGGWTIPVAAGTYDVTCSGGVFAGTSTARVTVTANNHAIDFRSGSAVGQVDFGRPFAPSAAVFSSADRGPAALDVDFAAVSDNPAAEFAWDFGDGAEGAGAMPSHTYDAPGAYVVRVAASDEHGRSGALTAVCADGGGGAGPGTMPPFSQDLKLVGCRVTADFMARGRDTVTFTAKFEMPGGWTRGLSPATVVAAGVKSAFPLPAGKDKLRDDAGNSFALKYKRPRHGAPLGGSVTGRVKVTLKGDLRALFADLGIDDQTPRRTIAGVPFVVMLGETGWTGRASLAVSPTPSGGATAAFVRP